MTLEELKSEFRIDLSGDSWGHSMGCFFDLCGELYHRGDDIPDHWHYGPGAASDPREPQSYWFEVFEEMDSAVMLSFGEILHRYTGMLRAAGRSY